MAAYFDLIKKVFRVPGQLYYKLMLWLFSFNPNFGKKDKAIVIGWWDFVSALNVRHVVISGGMGLVFIAVYGLTLEILPTARFSVLSFTSTTANALIHVFAPKADDLRGNLYLVLIILMVISGAFRRLIRILVNLPQAMSSEEVRFRKGSESMTWNERLRSCLVFAFSYFAYLVYPLAVVPALFVTGVTLIVTYNISLQKLKNRELAVRENAIILTNFTLFLICLLAGFLFSL